MRIIIVIIMFTIITGCNVDAPRISKSIEYAKRSGVFVDEYYFNLTLNKELESIVQIESIWIEKNWFKTGYFSKIKLRPGYHIVIRMKDEKWKDQYFKKWSLGTDFNFNFAPAGKLNLKSSSFKELPDGDLSIQFQRRRYFDARKKDVIGNLELFLKK